MTFCEHCSASLTSTDYEAGACTQCGEPVEPRKDDDDESKHERAGLPAQN